MPTRELPIIQYSHNLRNRVKHVERFPDTPVLSTNKNLEQYVDAVFDGLGTDQIYVRYSERPHEGFGPHFDMMADFVHPEYPFVATFNLWGGSVLRATALDEHLRRDYEENFPIPDSDAYVQRRNLSRYVLGRPNSTVYRHAGLLRENSGVIIPQVKKGPLIVHEIEAPAWVTRYDDADEPSGAFLKFVVPNSVSASPLTHIGFKPFSDFDEELQRHLSEHEAREDKVLEDMIDRDERRELGESVLAHFGITVALKYD